MNENKPIQPKVERAIRKIENELKEHDKGYKLLEKYLNDTPKENELKAYARGSIFAYNKALEILKAILD